MAKAHRRAATALGIVLACCACVAALDPSLDVSQYAHTSWKVREGFAKGMITSVAQTPDGYIWLGTEFGMYRFDGVRAILWQAPGGQSLPSEKIDKLLVTHDGTLWIGTDKGLASWNKGKLSVFPEMAQQGVGNLLEGHDGTLWVGSFANPEPARICAIRAGSIQCGGNDGILGNGVLGLYEDTNGNLWAGAQKGFWRWKPGPAEFFPLDSINGVRGFAEEDEASLLIGSNGLQRLVRGRVEPSALSPAAAVKRMLRDHDGGLWVGTLDRGLVHVHNGRTDSFSQSDGLSGDAVEEIFEDREGNIWVATADGLDRFRAYSVVSFGPRQGLSGVFAVLTTTDGSIWTSTLRGLKRWDHERVVIFGSQNGSQKSNGMINGHFPTSLFEDRRGRIWVATLAEFGYLLDDRFVAVINFPSGQVTSIVEDAPGHLWLSNHQAGLFHVFHNKLVQQIPWAGLGHADYASVLLNDPVRGGLWLGFSKGGITYFSDSALRESYSTANGLGEGRVNGLAVGPRGALWVATEHGLSRLKDGRIATLTSKNGLPCDAVHWTMEDDDHAFWLYMSCGLARIERRDLDAWAADPTKSVKPATFDTSDGVLSHSAAGSFTPSVGKSPDGKLWFTTWDGVSVIDPRHLPFNKLPPPVHIEQVTADDKPYDATNGLRLPPHVRYLAIDYTALSLVAPEKVRFRYKLEGEDKDWREVVNDRHVQYTNLPPKHYRFRVLACNNSGVWNEQGASLDFVIPPAWYQTNWFYALCVMAFLALLWGLYQLRVLQLQREFSAALEARVGERTRVARDLHDTLLQSFQALLPRLQAAIYRLPDGAVDARKTLEAVVDQAAEAVTEGRDAVQGLRMSTVEKNDLALAIRTVGEELASAETNHSSPNFKVVVEGTSRNLHAILRDEVYRVATEALRNAFRHAAAQNVEAEIHYDEKYFRLRVRDDGKGMGAEVLRGDGREGHYGLHGMKERAKLVGGKLTIWSEVDGGTEIELIIPASRAYAIPSRGFWQFGKRSGTDTDVEETIERE